MKIFINGKYLITRMTGVQRVAVELVAALGAELDRRNAGDRLVMLRPPEWMSRSRYRPLLAFLWEQLVLPVRARGGLLVSLCNTGPVWYPNQLIVLADAAVFDMPANYGSRYVAMQRWMMRRHAAFARRILTVSGFSRRQLEHWLRTPPGRIGMLDLGADHITRSIPTADARVLDRIGVRTGGYVLAIGSRQPGKNFAGLMKAAQLAQLPLPIVIAGGIDLNVFGTTNQVDDGHVISAGYVTDGELIALLQHARCYVQPSLYEGFGLPVIEAMALGIPVACSNAASLPEVCGNAAAMFDPTDPARIAQVLTDCLANDAVLRSMGEAGLVRAQGYTWSRAALRLLDEHLEPLLS